MITEENGNNSDSGGDRIGGGDGSIGSDSGSAGNGSNRDADGSSGDANGDNRNAGGNDSAGNGGGGNVGNDSAQPDAVNVGDDNKSVNGDSDTARAARGERERARRPIRLSSRNRDTDSAADGDDSADAEQRIFGEPVIRLGARGKGQPKAKQAETGASEFKIGETRELISVFLSSIFEIPAITLRQDFWRLTNDENKMLTGAVVDYLKSMPKSKSSRVAQFISEHLPIVNLAMIAFFILSDRVRSSIAIAQVTKAGRAFNIGAETTKATASGDTIRTPMDEIFS